MKEKNCYYLNEVSDLQNELKRFDVLVLPSYREGLSKVLLEACNAGLPIITTDVPGCNELVVNNGFIIEPKSSISLEKALLKFSKLSDDKILNFGKNSIELIKKKYSIDIVIDKYLDKIT